MDYRNFADFIGPACRQRKGYQDFGEFAEKFVGSLNPRNPF